MIGYRADLPGLDQLVSRLAGFDARAEALVADLESAVQRTHGEWSGPAAGAHLAAHRRWTDAAARMRTAAGELRDLVGTASTNYEAAIDANRRMWS